MEPVFLSLNLGEPVTVSVSRTHKWHHVAFEDGPKNVKFFYLVGWNISYWRSE